jgi:signal transduction histidine kinase
MNNWVDQHGLLTYIANLELEVDRLRKQCQLVQHESTSFLKQIQLFYDSQSLPARDSNHDPNIDEKCRQFAAILRDLREPVGYHPAHDQVVPIALKPLIEQVFRCQQRLLNAPQIILRLELEIESIEWFPSRLRHILDNLISNAVRYRDAHKGETRVTLALRVLASGYELRLSDNGIGMTLDQSAGSLELFFRSAPARAAGLGVGLAVAKLLVEQSGGALTSDSNDGQGVSIVAILPRFDVDDFLERTSKSSIPRSP